MTKPFEPIFVVTAKSFRIYKAFHEAIQEKTSQLKYASGYNTFSEDTHKTCNCMCFSNKFFGHQGEPVYAFVSYESSPIKTMRVWDLGTDFDEALDYVLAWAAEVKGIKLKITQEHTAIITKNEVRVGCKSFNRDEMKAFFKTCIKKGIIKTPDIDVPTTLMLGKTVVRIHKNEVQAYDVSELTSKIHRLSPETVNILYSQCIMAGLLS